MRLDSTRPEKVAPFPQFLTFTRGDGQPVTIAQDAVAMVAPNVSSPIESTLITLKTGDNVCVLEEIKDVVEMLS